jgi:uncharacterized membrane protein YphA (DoxX/SURF4 family)
MDARRDDAPPVRAAAAVALRVVAAGVGLFFLGMSLNKISWLANPELLSERFALWLPTASPYARVYLEAVAIPGAPLFARLVPLAEFCTALALLTGTLTRAAAAAALVMILNFHFATSAFSSGAFLRDGQGPPMIAALLALAIAGDRLPFTLRWPWR